MEFPSKIQTKRSHFSQEEDDTLKNLVHKYGENEWGVIASEMPNRSIRQCRERWQNHLKESVHKGKWSPEEDHLLKVKYQQHGPKWKLMEQFFPGRTSINIRNRFSCLRRFNELYSNNNVMYNPYQTHFNQVPIFNTQSSNISTPNTTNMLDISDNNIHETNLSSSPAKQNFENFHVDEEHTPDPFEDDIFNMDFGLEFLYDNC